MITVAMPRLSDSMEEGTVLRWLLSEGAEVKRGQGLVEIETDKASMVYEADDSGLLHIVASEGETLPVGAPIAQLMSAGEQPPETEMPSSTRAAGLESTVAPHISDQTQAATEETRIKASPLARRLASSEGVDLGDVAGSGPGGRIVRADVERAQREGAQHGTAAAQGKGHAEIIDLTRTQSLIARRMAEAKATIPEFTLQRTVDMEEAVRLRSQLKSMASQDLVPSLNDMVVRACANALRDSPRVNASYRDGRFELHSRINIGVAVATADSLLVPVIHDADALPLHELAHRTRRVAERVRDGSITPPELSGGTFSVSNLGMYGVDSFTAVINPPQAAILAVGAVTPRTVALDGEPRVRNVMTLTLTCDHRILYGAEAAQFLDRVRLRLEQPATLIA